MQTRNPLLHDLSRVATGAASAVAGIKGEIEALARQFVERRLASLDLVPRDEFDAVRAMAAEARAENDRLARRLAALEEKLAPAAPGRTGAARSAKKATPTKSALSARAARRRTKV
ncbi:MAG TPA: accessory factor UbiK family protein [Rhodospirillales bacterium]|jgi:hypothetical protein|nr:accessory factor UbiK family protein [Rhodospirillales bacterium]HJO68433.1 accessory factor UbiK family protein [Rhodospirillales bacterium]